MEFLRNKTFAFFRYLLFFLFLGYYSSITLFFHAHLVNGKIIVHSHPFRSNDKNLPFPSHKHSAAAYNLIQQLNELNVDDDSCQIVIANLLPSWYEIKTWECVTPRNSCYNVSLLRAPPVA